MRPQIPIDATLAALAVGAVVAGAPLVAAGCVAAGLTGHVLGVAWPRSQFYGPVAWRLPATAGDAAALTFDDGPHDDWTPRILDALAAAQARATFFVVGVHARARPALLRRMLADGHAVGVHSDTHARAFALWPRRRVAADLTAAVAAVADATGVAPRLFRPPAGMRHPGVLAAATDLGLTTVLWSARAWDAAGGDPATIAGRLGKSLRPRAIVCAHDGQEPGREATQDRSATPAAVADILRDWRGPRLVALAADGPGRVKPATPATPAGG